MAERAGTLVLRDGDELRITMPAGRNPWFIASAVVFGGPWLTVVVIGAVMGARQIPDRPAALVWVFVVALVVALTGLIDLVAAATIWLAVYALIGRETVEVTPERAVIRRMTGPFGFPTKLRRGASDRVTRIDLSMAPGRVPRPKVEIDFGRTRARFGAGISDWDADRVVEAIAAFVDDAESSAC